MLPATVLAGSVFRHMQPANAQADLGQAATLDAGVRAVIYGLPLVLLDITMKQATNVVHPSGFKAPVNQFAHVRAFPSADFKAVVRANVDTLYSSAFLDLSREPVVLSVPDTHGHYYLMPMIDAWSNVFASPGTRTTGSGAHSFVITGPGWTGPLPACAATHRGADERRLDPRPYASQRAGRLGGRSRPSRSVFAGAAVGIRQALHGSRRRD